MPLPDFDKLASKYRRQIDHLIDNAGKNVRIVFPVVHSNVNDNFDDPLRPGSIRKPAYKAQQSDNKPTKAKQTRTIKALIEWNPQELEDFGDLSITQDKTIVRLKTYLTDVPDLERAEYIIPNFDSDNILQTRFEIFRQPVPRGFKTDRYAYTYWSSI